MSESSVPDAADVADARRRILAFRKAKDVAGLVGEVRLALQSERAGSDPTWTALTALERLGAKDAAPVLVECLESSNTRYRVRAARLLGKLGAPEHAPALRTAVKDADDTVRWNAVKSLGYIGGTEDLDVLRSALEDPEPLVRKAAAESIARLGLADAADDLRALAKREGLLGGRRYRRLARRLQ